LENFLEPYCWPKLENYFLKRLTSYNFKPNKFNPPKNVVNENLNSAESTKRLIDIERTRVINEAIKLAEDILKSNEAELRNIVDFLVQNEVIHTDELKEIIGKDKKLDDLPEDS